MLDYTCRRPVFRTFACVIGFFATLYLISNYIEPDMNSESLGKDTTITVEHGKASEATPTAQNRSIAADILVYNR